MIDERNIVAVSIKHTICYADPSIAWLQKRWPRRDKENEE